MKLLKNFLLALPVTLFAAPAISMPQPCGVSYTFLPNGKCVDLTYITILGQARAQAQATAQDYQTLFDANVTLDMSRDYRKGETKEERDSRYTTLAKKGIEVEKVSASTQKIEDLAYPLHRRAMMLVKEAYWPRQ